MKLVLFLQKGLSTSCIQPGLGFSGCSPLVSGRWVAQLIPLTASKSFKSKKNAESCLSGANGHWVDSFLGSVRD